jgi:7,8-dihydropterin-6-yl-methyl-4-(beta-D-ribofuranosyl)aminobenzene 5'-phosphate synthase
MNLSITTLIENSVGMNNLDQEDLSAEWGLSVLLHTDSRSILFDTGRSGAVVSNARVLGVDLQAIDTIVLSHGHLDHTGGLRKVLQQIGKSVDVVAHPDSWEDKYIKISEKPERFINIPFRKQELERLGAGFVFTKEPFEIAAKIMTTGEIPLTNDFESIHPPENMERFIKRGDRQENDLILDDSALVIDAAQGLVVVLGCAHRGVINTLHHAQRITGKEKILAVLGGAHLHDATETHLRFVIGSLKKLELQIVALNHCTGLSVACRLNQEFGDTFHFNPTGTKFNFEL